MAIRRSIKKLLYRIDTLSPARLVLCLAAFVIIPTVLILFLINPQKFFKIVLTKQASVPLSPIGKFYEEAGVSHELENMLPNFNPYVLVYNRVPKCASIYTTRILYRLGTKEMNNYKVTSPYISGEHPWLSDEELQDHVHWISEIHGALKKPLVYIRHQYFIDFEKWGGNTQPIYMNIIRDPVDRFTSFYYFVRNGNEEGDGAEVKMPEMKKRLTLDECVQMRDRECMQPKWQLIPYFCGQEPMCRHRASWALEKAKQNIERYFPVIGIVEDLDTTFGVMEKVLPRYFKGARELNSSPVDLSPNDTRTIGKIKPSELTRKILKTRTSLALEYELYEFVRERLYRMAKQLRV